MRVAPPYNVAHARRGRPHFFKKKLQVLLPIRYPRSTVLLLGGRPSPYYCLLSCSFPPAGSCYAPVDDSCMRVSVPRVCLFLHSHFPACSQFQLQLSEGEPSPIKTPLRTRALSVPRLSSETAPPRSYICSANDTIVACALCHLPSLPSTSPYPPSYTIP